MESREKVQTTGFLNFNVSRKFLRRKSCQTSFLWVWARKIRAGSKYKKAGVREMTDKNIITTPIPVYKPKNLRLGTLVK